ncbi:uncharacterized protein Z518_07737 [Rhinocladiella mackenziei CBS 650.93]|uniref:polynucleotide adenylyltransferase n=1 Tax=Rhinocladiella mackenziei CBS 650.93 TaxID=1442369 RepID=A0A0D2H155_9EURO|nr:uncharacterized protein Z518_07737 [Rhinocladiella mackenziei CBS 650.93]KIX04183.1 hypothetical protein Z518_07737 [Rhinocladiella mackenziei CBS 650.93]
MDASSNHSGFSDHVWSQLHQASRQSAQRRGRNRGGRSSGRFATTHHQHFVSDRGHATFADGQQQPPLPTNMESFPPLGATSASATASASASIEATPYAHSQFHVSPFPPPPPFNNPRHGTPREYQERARGNYRGYSGRFAPQHHVPPFAQPVNMAQHQLYGRPPPRPGPLYQYNANVDYSAHEEQRSVRHAIVRQADYLNRVGKHASDSHKLTLEEKTTKENFRKQLEEIARKALGAQYSHLEQDEIRLKCYGSLANGFGLAGCDMDLLLILPDSPKSTADHTEGEPEPQLDVHDDEDEKRKFHDGVRRLLEKTYLDQEFGARLLTKTRVPILRICQYPSPELLRNLREYRAAWERVSFETPPGGALSQPSEDVATDVDAVEHDMTDLALANTAPRNPLCRGNAGLEFVGDCGIQCDINFTNFVAAHNTNLLRLYHSWDSRVGQIGTFVKIWAKARDVNTPYRGTLSSYGYILMVLHYLMNVVKPAIIPNLQHLAKKDDAWEPDRKIELFEGFDIRFVQDSTELKQIRDDMARNNESAGQLLRGFFEYYASPRGFHWTRDVISIRVPDGRLSKQDKGWTEAKWAHAEEKSVRLRYLLAIEDPFEVDHNVGRTVGHHGIVAIRNEFRRAWSILERVGAGEEVSIDEFLEPTTGQVDTLKKDQQFHRQKQIQMREELEAKEKLLLQKGNDEEPDAHLDGTLGSSDQEKIQAGSSAQGFCRLPNPKLTSALAHQEKKKKSRPSRSWRHRKIEVDSDDEDDGVDPTHDRNNLESTKSNAAEPKNEPKKRLGGLCSLGDVLLANGLDHWGNPVAWDIETQEGRWLRWRDSKVEKGTLHEFRNPTLQELHEQCPFDPRRPSPYIGKPYKNLREKLQAERPPWPSNKPSREHSDTKATHPEPSEQINSEDSNQVGKGEASINPPQHVRSGRVGRIIPWDVTTAGGEWLQYRDGRIRKGRWQHHQYSRFTELSNAFPYNPNMTWAELEEKNQQLRVYYKSTIRSTLNTEVDAIANVAAQSSVSPSNDEDRNSGETGSAKFGGDTPSISNHLHQDGGGVPAGDQSSSLENLNKLGESVDDKPLTATVPSHATDSGSHPTTSTEQPDHPDQEFIRARRLAFFAKLMTPANSAPEVNPQFYPSMPNGGSMTSDAEQFQTPVQSHEMPLQFLSQDTMPANHFTQRASSTLGECSSAGSSAESLHPGRDESDDTFDMRESDNENLSPLRVPPTLYPGADSGRRPKDEDPRIMPIPRVLGFQFDPQQLRDLAVIAKGGNGCAREGAEFNIEDEYEWGGGGMMGGKTSTGKQYVGMSSSDTPYESGKGDEGLLDELPKVLD